MRDLAPTKKEGGGTSKIARKQIIENEIQLLLDPPYSLEDDPNWIIDQEAKFLGCPITLTKIEASNTSHANTSCKDIVNGKKGKGLCVAASVSRIAEYKIKKGEQQGKMMAFLTIEDESAILDSVVMFPKVKEKYKYILYEGNNLVFCGSVAKNEDSLIVEKIYEV